MNKLLLGRITIEMLSPMSLNTGERDLGYDGQLATDWNGNPFIPSSSITGVLRSFAYDYSALNEGQLSKNDVDSIFGVSALANQKSLVSSIYISDALLLNSKSEIDDTFLTQEERKKDEVYEMFTNQFEHRDRCRVNQNGSASYQGKFDTLVLPKGLRFSFTVKVILNGNTNSELEECEFKARKILSLFSEKGMAFGSSSTIGYGQFKLLQMTIKTVDLYIPSSNTIDFQKIKEISKQMNQLRDVKTPLAYASNNEDLNEKNDLYEVLFELPLKSTDAWQTGSGKNFAKKINLEDEDKQRKFRHSYSANVIEWKNDLFESVDQKVCLCGSSIKGIISHRIEYYYRALTGDFVNLDGDNSHFFDNTVNDSAHQIARPQELKELLGAIDAEDNAQAAKIIIDDTYVSFESNVIRARNSIDRFSGGTRKTALFFEEKLCNAQFTIRAYISSSYLKNMDKNIAKAIYYTILDIEKGLLPLASGSGRGGGLTILNNESQTKRYLNECIDLKKENTNGR